MNLFTVGFFLLFLYFCIFGPPESTSGKRKQEDNTVKNKHKTVKGTKKIANKLITNNTDIQK